MSASESTNRFIGTCSPGPAGLVTCKITTIEEVLHLDLM